MTDIEPKEAFRQIGINLINEYRQQRGLKPIDWLAIDNPEASAFIRSIQLHEKTKEELQGVKQEFDDFQQEVSDAVQSWVDGGIDSPAYLWFRKKLGKFIIPKPKPDPLVDVAKSLGYFNTVAKHWAGDVRAALDALGFEIREKNDD
jgi:hypothetical protein